jgi:hypothetical protein
MWHPSSMETASEQLTALIIAELRRQAYCPRERW